MEMYVGKERRGVGGAMGKKRRQGGGGRGEVSEDAKKGSTFQGQMGKGDSWGGARGGEWGGLEALGDETLSPIHAQESVLNRNGKKAKD